MTTTSPCSKSLLAAVLIAGLGGAFVTGCATSPGVITGSVQSGYILSSAEANWQCSGLDTALQARIVRITALTQQIKAEEADAAPTVSRLFSRMAGEPDSPALAEIRSERAAADAYNEALRKKGCAAVDIDARIAGTAPVLQPPAAVVPKTAKQRA